MEIIKDKTVQKGLLIIVGATVAFFVTRYVVNQVRAAKREKEAMQGAKNEVESATKVAADLTKTQKPTLSALQLSTIANQLYMAMSGFGTDEEAIYRAFANVKNDLDVVNVIKAFGVRLKLTLSQWLTSELDPSEMKALNDLLSRKGIKYRF